MAYSDMYNPKANNDYNLPLMGGPTIFQNRSSSSKKSNRYQEEFNQKIPFNPADPKEPLEEDGYDSFLRKYQIDGKPQEITTNQDTTNAGLASNYSNFIEQKKLENNLSFSNNAIEPHLEYEDEDTADNLQSLQNLDELDLDYEEQARQKQMSHRHSYYPEDEIGK